MWEWIWWLILGFGAFIAIAKLGESWRDATMREQEKRRLRRLEIRDELRRQRDDD